MIEGVDMIGGAAEGQIFNPKGTVKSCGSAHYRMMLMEDPNLTSAYFWSANANTLIEKPSKKM